ncbi:curli assembly protein CsgF [Fulvimarina endophytica]|uniref:curli assembly protein CsgF n=1 Tax=Fulvimarina endophytica TaxID=2293836 RepID=UPI001FE07553|nr:curli assembly protein CsgF [Fulvimarina endophytica]
MSLRFRLISISLLVSVSGSATAGDLVYQPINPSFGGNPLYSAHLLGIANAQRDATASDAGRDDAASALTAGRTQAGTSDADLFVRQLQGRLLSALAGQVTDAIFGDQPQTSGTVRFGDTTVTFQRGLAEIRLSILNSTDGTITDIVVPVLQTSAIN